jgi:hypothetical protein
LRFAIAAISRHANSATSPITPITIATAGPNDHPIHIASTITAGPISAHRGTPGGGLGGSRLGDPPDSGRGCGSAGARRPNRRRRGVGMLGASGAVVSGAVIRSHRAR